MIEVATVAMAVCTVVADAMVALAVVVGGAGVTIIVGVDVASVVEAGLG